MRKSVITNPYNNLRNGELNFSKQSNIMPSFLLGSSNNVETLSSNSRIIPSNQTSEPLNIKSNQGINLRRAQSIHRNSSRSNMPPITNTWAKSPPSTYLRSKPMTEEHNALSFTKSPSMFNQSNDRVNQSFNESFLNQSTNLKDSDSYNKFMQIKTEANEDSFENWVTVFGYGPTQAQSILGYFLEIGPIVNKIISNNGNWMHLQYEIKMHAISALNKNGRIINSMAMIGVKPCDDKTPEIPYTVNLSQIYPKMNNNTTTNNDTKANQFNEVQPEKPLNMSFNTSSMRPLASREILNGNNTKCLTKPGILNRALSMIWK